MTQPSSPEETEEASSPCSARRFDENHGRYRLEIWDEDNEVASFVADAFDIVSQS
jgi:hypothetical protein